MKLIDKDAAVAEIEKLKSKVDDSSSYCNGWQYALRMLELSLDTLEVKEVDLKKEISDNWESGYELGLGFSQYADIAKHFFKLGLQARKEEHL